MEARPTTLLIACGALANEMTSLIRQRGWQQAMRLECLPANLHNRPEAIPEAVRAKIRAARGHYDRILVLYADCGTGGGLDRVLAEEGIERIPGVHCYEIFAGAATFREMMAEEPGSYFLTDFLARHFMRLVYQGLGLDRYPRLRHTYFRNYRKMVYLTQQDDPELLARARQAAEAIGLPLERRFTGLGGYESFLAAKAGGEAADDGGEQCTPCA